MITQVKFLACDENVPGSNPVVVTYSDGSSATFNYVEGHPMYEALQSWESEGNTPEPFDDTITWQDIRAKRDGILRETDWTMIPGCTVDQAQWAAYRQNLRDLPSTYAETGPESVVWPVQPSTSGPNTIEE